VRQAFGGSEWKSAIRSLERNEHPCNVNNSIHMKTHSSSGLLLGLNPGFGLTVCVTVCCFCILLTPSGSYAQADLQATTFNSLLPNPTPSGSAPTNLSWSYRYNGPQSVSFMTVLTDFYFSRNDVFGDADDTFWVQNRRDFTFSPPVVGFNNTITLGIPATNAAYRVPAGLTGSFYVFYRLSYAPGTLVDNVPANNVARLPGTFSITGLDTDPPTVTSIARLNPAGQLTRSNSVTWRVTFSEQVTNVSTNDFTLVDLDGTLAGESLTSVNSGAGTNIDVTANTGSGSGRLRLDVLAAVATIQDTANNSLNANFTSGDIYLIDRSAPTTVDVVDVTPDPRFSAVTNVDVVFSEPIDLSTFGFADLSLTSNGVSVALNSGVTASAVSGSTYRVNGLAAFTAAPAAYVLSVNGSGINDLAGNSGIGAASDSWSVIRPSLSIRKATNSVVISWPALADGYVLESRVNLGPPGADWSTVGTVPVVVGNQKTIALTSPAGNEFFRLRRP